MLWCMRYIDSRERSSAPPNRCQILYVGLAKVRDLILSLNSMICYPGHSEGQYYTSQATGRLSYEIVGQTYIWLEWVNDRRFSKRNSI